MSNVATKIEKESGTMHPEHSIIRGAWNCDYTEVDNALKENPDCINDRDWRNGMTAAHICVGLQNLDMLKRIVSVDNYDPFIKDNFNRHAFDCVNQPGMVDFRKILLHKMYGVFPHLKDELRFS